MKKNLLLKNLVHAALISTFAIIMVPQIGSAQFVPADKVLSSKVMPSASTVVLSTNHPRNRAETTSVVSVKDTKALDAQYAPAEVIEMTGTLTSGGSLPVFDTSWVTQMNNQSGNTPPVVNQQQASASQGGFVQNNSATLPARGIAPAPVAVPAVAQTYQDSARGPVVIASQNTAPAKTIKKITKRVQLEPIEVTDHFADNTHTSRSQYGASVSGIGMSVSLVGILLIILVFLVILNMFKKAENKKQVMGIHQAMPAH